MDRTVYGQLQMHTQGRHLKPELQYYGTSTGSAVLTELLPSKMLQQNKMVNHRTCACTKHRSTLSWRIVLFCSNTITLQCSTITADIVHSHTTIITAGLALFHNNAIIVHLALFCTFHFSIATPFPTADLALKTPLPQMSPALQHYNLHTWEYSATVLWCPQKLQHLLIAVTHIHFFIDRITFC